MNPQKAQTEHLPCKETQIPNRKAQKAVKSIAKRQPSALADKKMGSEMDRPRTGIFARCFDWPSLVHNSSLKNGVLL